MEIICICLYDWAKGQLKGGHQYHGRDSWPLDSAEVGMEGSTKAELASQRLKERMRRDEAKVQDPIQKNQRPRPKGTDADLHIAAHPLNAEDEAWGDGPDEREQSEHEPSESLSDSSQCPVDSSGVGELADDD